MLFNTGRLGQKPIISDLKKRLCLPMDKMFDELMTKNNK